jgi:integrase/recombinase XerD
VRHGKGDKPRSAFIGKATARALSLYLRQEDLDPECPLFVSGRGDKAPMTRSAVQQGINRLCRMAGISKKGVSPHAFRRTFAVNLLRSGANVFSVQNLLGHTNLTMTRRYCAIAEADIQAQHRLHSPADKLTRR